MISQFAFSNKFQIRTNISSMLLASVFFHIYIHFKRKKQMGKKRCASTERELKKQSFDIGGVCSSENKQHRLTKSFNFSTIFLFVCSSQHNSKITYFRCVAFGYHEICCLMCWAHSACEKKKMFSKNNMKTIFEMKQV